MLGSTLELTGARPAAPSPRALTGAEPFAARVARCFNLERAPSAATTTLTRGQIDVTRLTDAEGTGLSRPLPVERAYAVFLQLRDTPGAELRRLGEPVASAPFLAGSIAIAHIADEPVLDLPSAFDMLLIRLPQVVFAEIAAERGATTGDDEIADAAGEMDGVIHHLGRALLPCLETQADAAFFDHVALAIQAHLVARYGQAATRPPPRCGALTPWQEKTAKEALSADLTCEPPLDDVAKACGVPANRFVRAFRQTTGMPPHRWRRGFRIERAKALLLASDLTLGQIAYDCGFADQSHFTRLFAAAIGAPPGAWRRERRG